MAGTIASTGLGSGVDINGIVDKLVALEKQPLQGLQKTASKIQSQISAYGALASQLSALDDATNTLATASNWSQWKAASSNPTAVSASVLQASSVSAGSYSIEVSRLASSQSVTSTPLAASAAVGTGSLTLPKAGSTVTVTINGSNNTPAGIVDAINQAGSDVTASLLTDALGSRIVLTGKSTGAANAFSVSVTTSDAPGTGLNQLAYDAATNTGTLTRNRQALDANLKVNGLALVSPSNQLDSTITGLRLTLTQETTSPLTVSVASDVDARRGQVQAFVQAFNQLASTLGRDLAYDPATKSGGPLQGDSAARNLQNALRAALFRPGTGGSSGYSTLSDIGIAFQKDGTLAIDDSKGKFTAALANGEALGRFFNDPQSGLFTRLKSLTGGLANAVSGPLATRTTALQGALKRNAADQQKVLDRADQIQNQLLKRYNAMDALVSKSNALNSYLTQQITNWNNQAKANN